MKGKKMNVSIPTQFLSINPNSKATFRPGGDAQYVSYLLGGIINSIADDNHRSNGEDFETYYHNLIKVEASNLEFSPALKGKFERAANRILDRELDRTAQADTKAARKVAKALLALKDQPLTFNPMGGHIAKIGRWTYPVAEGSDGQVYRNLKTDGSGEWTLAAADSVIDA